MDTQKIFSLIKELEKEVEIANQEIMEHESRRHAFYDRFNESYIALEISRKDYDDALAVYNTLSLGTLVDLKQITDSLSRRVPELLQFNEKNRTLKMIKL